MLTKNLYIKFIGLFVGAYTLYKWYQYKSLPILIVYFDTLTNLNLCELREKYHQGKLDCYSLRFLFDFEFSKKDKRISATIELFGGKRRIKKIETILSRLKAKGYSIVLLDKKNLTPTITQVLLDVGLYKYFYDVLGKENSLGYVDTLRLDDILIDTINTNIPKQLQ